MFGQLRYPLFMILKLPAMKAIRRLEVVFAHHLKSGIETVNAQGTTVFVATHDTELIKRKPFRTIHIDEGQVVNL